MFKQLKSMLPHNVETCQFSQTGTGRICYAISQYQCQSTTTKARFWAGLAIPISDEGQYPCSKQLQLLFLHNEGTICQFHKLAWAGIAVPISDEGQYLCLKQLQLLFSIMKARFVSFTNWHGQD